METYIGCKIISAKPATYGEFRKEKYGESTMELTLPLDAPGYIVVYPAIGLSKEHVSWSPKEVFETAYRKVAEAEKSLLLKEEDIK